MQGCFVSNRTLSNQEIIKILQLYETYGKDEKSRAARLPDFLQMLWGEAYDLGQTDGYNESANKHFPDFSNLSGGDNRKS